MLKLETGFRLSLSSSLRTLKREKKEAKENINVYTFCSKIDTDR